MRLGVVLDTRNPIERLREVARMCDRAGIGALWVEDPPDRGGEGDANDASDGGGPARLDAWTALAALAGEVRDARIGAVLDADAWHPPRLARMAATVGALTGGRFELSLRRHARDPGDPPPGPGAAGPALRALREAIAATTVPAALATPAAGPAYGAVALPAERPTIGVEVDPAAPEGVEEVAAMLPLADDLVLPRGPLTATMAAATAARGAAARAGRAAATVGVAARLPVSVGRTVAEAQARWDAEPAFAAFGPSADAAVHGLYGTLEQCHDRVVALAHAGVSDLRCLLPNAIDVHDVIAQLTAMTVGTVERSVPGAPRTRVPSPPPGWGGRSRFPPPS